MNPTNWILELNLLSLKLVGVLKPAKKDIKEMQMKKTIIVIITFLNCLSGSAQDTITFHSGNVIRAHILEKSDSYIKYKPDSIKYSHTTFVTKLTNLREIHYSNGEVDLLSLQNPRSIYPLGIHVSTYTYDYTIHLTGGIDYFFNPKISAELNFGSFTKYYRTYFIYTYGGKYWLSRRYGKSGFSPFIGLFYGENTYDNFFEVPIGISYIAKFGLQTSLQLDLIKNINEGNYLSAVDIELRLGWRFKVK